VTTLTYDAGALIAAERDDRRVWALHRRALARGATPTVPAAVLVEAWRGHERLARFLVGTTVEPLDGSRARRAAMVLRASGSSATIDATVVEGALRRGDAVVTSDRGDLEALAEAVGRRLAVIDV
jgi:hypothetical protein